MRLRDGDRCCSHDAVIHVYDDAGNVIETNEHAGDFKEWWSFSSHHIALPTKMKFRLPLSSDDCEGRERIRRNNPAIFRVRRCSLTPMNEAESTASEASFATHLREASSQPPPAQRSDSLFAYRQTAASASERAHVLEKTAGRCHICGGLISGSTWHADHVLAHSTGGAHRADNYLPAHALCNNYRWDYSAEEFQHILKIGVWTRTQIERRTRFGRDAAAAFLAYDRTRQARRASAIPSSRFQT